MVFAGIIDYESFFTAPHGAVCKDLLASEGKAASVHQKTRIASNDKIIVAPCYDIVILCHELYFC